MSLVIAYKQNNRFILGADKQATCGWNKKVHTATKIWKAYISDTDYYCMGAVGSARGAQVIANIQGLLDGLPFGTKEIPDAFINITLPRCLYETLKNNGLDVAIDSEEEGKHMYLPCAYFFAYKDRCWFIGQDMTVEEVGDYMAMGSGEECAIGSIDTSVMYKEKNPFRIITTAIDIAAERTLHVDHEIEFVETVEQEADLMQQMEALDPAQAAAIKEAIKAQKKAEKEAKVKQKEAEAKKKAKADKKAKKKPEKTDENEEKDAE